MRQKSHRRDSVDHIAAFQRHSKVISRNQFQFTEVFQVSYTQKFPKVQFRTGKNQFLELFLRRKYFKHLQTIVVIVFHQCSTTQLLLSGRPTIFIIKLFTQFQINFIYGSIKAHNSVSANPSFGYSCGLFWTCFNFRHQHFTSFLPIHFNVDPNTRAISLYL